MYGYQFVYIHDIFFPTLVLQSDVKTCCIEGPVAGNTVRVKGEFLPWGWQLLGLSLKQLSHRAHTKRDQNRKGQRRPAFRLVKVKTGASQRQQMTVLSQKKTWTYIERKMMTTDRKKRADLSGENIFYKLK